MVDKAADGEPTRRMSWYAKRFERRVSKMAWMASPSSRATAERLLGTSTSSGAKLCCFNPLRALPCDSGRPVYQSLFYFPTSLQTQKMTSLADLKPTAKQTVTQITQKLGIAMGSQYDWSFSNPNTGTHLLNIWHADMLEDNGEIYFIDDSAEWADRNRGTAVTVQLNRASAVTSLILTAYYTKQPVHVAILVGVRKQGINERDTSEAHQRELDDVLWYPHHRGADGRIRVVRGKPQAPGFDPQAELNVRIAAKPRPIPEPPNKVEIKGATTFERDTEVVKAAKSRAADGRCELCKKEGFRTAGGGFYLEGHHVIPLNCGGLDDERNVVAICPDDHRRAHYGEDRHVLRDRMIWEVLSIQYPADLPFFEMLDEKSHDIARSELSLRKLEDNRVET